MPRIKLSKSAIDALPISASDLVYWDAGCRGFGVKVTPKGRKVFIVLYRTGGSGSRLRKFTIGPYGRVTLHQARVAAQKVFAAKLEGRDPAAEKREAKRRVVTDRVEDLLEAFIAQRVSQNSSASEMSRLLRRELGKPWGNKSIHEVTKRDVIDVISAIEQRGATIAANKALKSIKTFLRWCVGRAVLDQSPAEGIPLPTKEIARDRVLISFAASIDMVAVMAWPSSQNCRPEPNASPVPRQPPGPTTKQRGDESSLPAWARQ